MDQENYQDIDQDEMGQVASEEQNEASSSLLLGKGLDHRHGEHRCGPPERTTAASR
jgi:hypothetical protein